MKGRSAPEKIMVVDGKPLPAVLDEAMIRAVVHGFYDEIRADDLLGPIFTRAIPPDQWPHHLANMCDFWSSTLLRTGRYEGRPLPPHLALPGIDKEHFQRWLALFKATVRRLCPPDAADLFMDRALRIAHSFRLAIAFHRNENSVGLNPILPEDL